MCAAIPRSRSDIEAALARFPVLSERRLQIAGTLSGGEQQMLAIGRALVARPRLLLLDEPSLGLAPKIVTPDFPHAARAQERGQDHSSGRAERAPGPAASPTTAMCSSADASSTAERERNCSTCPRCSAHISGKARRERSKCQGSSNGEVRSCGKAQREQPNENSAHNSRREMPMKSRIMLVAACVAAALLRRPAKRAGRETRRPYRQDRLPRAAHRQGRRVGPGRQARDRHRGRGNQRQGRHRRPANRDDLLRRPDARIRSAPADEPPRRSRQGAGGHRTLLQRAVRNDRAAARRTLQDARSIPTARPSPACRR